MTRQWRRRIAQIVWVGLQDPARRSRWWRRIKRGCGIALLLLLLLSCLSCLLLGVLVGRVSATDAEARLDVMLVVDNSNSMFDKGGLGSDPDLRRIEAAQMFIDYLGVDSGQVSHRLGVVFFGGEAELVVPLTPLADQARRAKVVSLIADPQRMDWTDPVAALTLARDTLLVEGDGDGQPVVVLLTDGKPEWDGDPTDTERQAVVERLKRLGQDYVDDGIRLFVVLLSNQATDADPEIETVYVPLWRAMVQATEGRFYPVRRADDLIDVYHDILVILSDSRTSGAIVEAELEGETRVEMIDVEPSLARVTFVVRVDQTGASATLGTDGASSTGTSTGQDTGMTVTIHRPGGEPLRPGDGDVRHAAQSAMALWAVTHPRPGEWAVVMTGEGTVTVWKDYLPAPITPTPSPTVRPSPTPSPTPCPRLIVDDWPEVVLAGQPVTLSVSFEPTLPEAPIVWAEWVVGDEQPGRARLLDDGREGDTRAGDGRYGGSFTPGGTGAILVRVWGEVGEREIAAWEGRLRVEACPTLELVAPSPEAVAVWQTGQPATVQTRWVVGEEKQCGPLAAGSPMTVTLRSADDSLRTIVTGTVGQPLALDVPRAAGIYSLTVRATGISSADFFFQGEAATTVIVRRPLPGWVWGAGVGLLLTTFGGWGILRWHRRLPRLEGRLRVLEAPVGYAGPALVDLSSLYRRSARVGGAGAELPIPAESSPWAVVRALSDGSGTELTPYDGREVRVNEAVLSGSHLLSDGDCIGTQDARLRYEHLRT